MAIRFGTDDWVKALMVEVNESEAYRSAARTWEGDFYFVIVKGAGISADIHLYMDLWHGECRDAYQADDPARKTPAFELRGSLTAWRKVIEKEVHPFSSIMSRQLKLKGNMTKIIRVPNAAIQLVECCTRIDTEWPS
jgi:putative sterol carrier protein